MIVECAVQIIEIGSLGLSGKSTDVPQVFVHQQFGSKFTNSTQIKDAMVSSADASEELAVRSHISDEMVELCTFGFLTTYAEFFHPIIE